MSEVKEKYNKWFIESVPKLYLQNEANEILNFSKNHTINVGNTKCLPLYSHRRYIYKKNNKKIKIIPCKCLTENNDDLNGIVIEIKCEMKRKSNKSKSKMKSNKLNNKNKKIKKFSKQNKLNNNKNIWCFNNGENEWCNCDNILNNNLERMSINDSIDYCIGGWNYKIIKIDNSLAKQYNKITTTERYLCKFEYIEHFQSLLDNINDYNNNNNKNNKATGQKIINNNYKKLSIFASMFNNATELETRARIVFESTMPHHKYRIAEIKDLISNNLLPQQHIYMYETILRYDNNNREIFGFHGTSSNKVKFIIKNGFNRTFNKNSLYGKGIYLAKNACLSVGFCSKSNDDISNIGMDDNDNNKYLCMFYCKAIINEMTVGKQDKTVQYKTDGIEEYNTLVDSLEHPKIYVIAKDYHVIPVVLIKFRCIDDLIEY